MQKRKWQNRVTKAVSCFLLEPRCRGKEASSGSHESSILETRGEIQISPAKDKTRRTSFSCRDVNKNRAGMIVQLARLASRFDSLSPLNRRGS
jgi:hypothetical protein